MKKIATESGAQEENAVEGSDVMLLLAGAVLFRLGWLLGDTHEVGGLGLERLVADPNFSWVLYAVAVALALAMARRDPMVPCPRHAAGLVGEVAITLPLVWMHSVRPWMYQGCIRPLGAFPLYAVFFPLLARALFGLGLMGAAWVSARLGLGAPGRLLLGTGALAAAMIPIAQLAGANSSAAFCNAYNQAALAWASLAVVVGMLLGWRD